MSTIAHRRPLKCRAVCPTVTNQHLCAKFSQRGRAPRLPQRYILKVSAWDRKRKTAIGIQPTAGRSLRIGRKTFPRFNKLAVPPQRAARAPIPRSPAAQRRTASFTRRAPAAARLRGGVCRVPVQLARVRAFTKSALRETRPAMSRTSSPLRSLPRPSRWPVSARVSSGPTSSPSPSPSPPRPAAKALQRALPPRPYAARIQNPLPRRRPFLPASLSLRLRSAAASGPPPSRLRAPPPQARRVPAACGAEASRTRRVRRGRAGRGAPQQRPVWRGLRRRHGGEARRDTDGAGRRLDARERVCCRCGTGRPNR